MDAVSNVPPPVNEPVRAYPPGSAERAAVEAKIKELAASPVELTMAVGGQQRMGGGDRIAVVEPHNHAHVLGHLGNATGADVSAAIDAAAAAAPGWPARGGPRSTRRRSSASPSRCTRPRSTRPVS